MRADVQRRSNEMVKGMWHLDYAFAGCEERQVYRILFGLWIWFLKHRYLIDLAPGLSCCVQELSLGGWL